MRKEEALVKLEANYLTVILRDAAQREAINVATALFGGGLRSFEVTFEGAEAEAALKKLKKQNKDWLVGAGTVLDLPTLRLAIELDADFVFCPHLDLTLLDYANQEGILLIPGVFTPTEIALAISHGALAVKLFPAVELGPGYLEALKGPFPNLKVIPTGGIGSENLSSFMKAGAAAVGMGGQLVDIKAIESEDWGHLRQRAEEVWEIVERERRKISYS